MAASATPAPPPVGEVSQRERAALLRLALGVEPGSAGLAAEIAEFGAAESVARLRRGVSPLGSSVRDAVLAVRLEHADVAGARVVLRGDVEYPGQLEDLDEPPLALWVRGALDVRMAALRSVAVVGARAASGYGERVAHSIGSDLARRDWTVVSGAAYGIDAAAHRGALSVSGPTLAVLACGVDIAYPRAHDTLLAAIADEGAVLSELPPGSAPLKFRFLARNRLIAALTRGTVVIEAALRSGAVSTANRALDLGRPLMSVPGPVDCPTSAGTNRMLCDQSARAVRDGDDVVAVLLGAVPGLPPAAGLESQGLPPDALAVALAMSMRSSSVGQLAGRTGLDPAVVTSMLGLLEVLGVAVRSVTGWHRAAPGAVGRAPGVR